MKTNVDRIQYYTHKVMQLAMVPFGRRKPDSLRYRRLMAYKDAVNKHLKQAGNI